EFLLRLAVGDHRADSATGEEGRDSRAACPDSLGERSLRIQLELQLARQILLGKELVFADVGRDHFLNLATLEQMPEAEAVRARVVGDDGQTLNPGCPNLGDEAFRVADQPEAAAHDGHAVAQQPVERGARRIVDLVHTPPMMVRLCSRMNCGTYQLPS